jgi:hypothetical protein
MEAFFSTVKMELADRFESSETATKLLFDYLEVFYNPPPLHDRLRESGGV